MNFLPVILYSDALVWLMVLSLLVGAFLFARSSQAQAWSRVGQRIIAHQIGMASATVLVVFVLIALLDSLHYRAALPPMQSSAAESSLGNGKTQYAVEVLSVLDTLVMPLRRELEKSYSAPFATRLFSQETVDLPDGQSVERVYPRLRYGGAHLHDENERMADILSTLGQALLWALALWLMLCAAVVFYPLLRRSPVSSPVHARFGCNKFAKFTKFINHANHTNYIKTRIAAIWQGKTRVAWRAILLTAFFLLICLLPLAFLAGDYHVLGTDKVGQDVFYQILKSVRVALIIGLVTTVILLPLAVVLGIVSGYFQGFIDDLIQYLYTVLNAIPGVLIIAAAVLMMQVVIDQHPQWFTTAAERADLRLIALCLILGMTSWTSLCRLLRAETLKLRELDYIQAARAFGVPSWTILLRHVLPNVMHIIIITLVMDFSSLVLAEAVLSYVGIGVDPTMISFGTMINNARMELGRDPVIWWSLIAAFIAMFTLVLAANLLADAVREAFDPHEQGAAG